MTREQVLFIVNSYVPESSFRYYSNIVRPEDTALEVVERELLINFDFYAMGSIETNIIYLTAELSAVVCTYEVIKETAEALNDGIDFLSSAIINIDAVLNTKIIYL